MTLAGPVPFNLRKLFKKLTHLKILPYLFPRLSAYLCIFLYSNIRKYRVLVGKPEGKNHLGDPDVDGRIILSWI